MLGKKHKKIITSTLAEIRGALPLVSEGLLEEVRTLHQDPIPAGAPHF